MGFEEFFENKQKDREYYKGQQYRDDERYSYVSHKTVHEHDNNQKLLNIVEKIKHNKKLKLLVVLAGIIILIIGIGLIILLWPIIVKIYNYLSQHGLKGVFDIITEMQKSIISFLDKILNGLGK